MKTRFLSILLAAGVLTAAFCTAFTIPAEAQTRTVSVRLPSGKIVRVTVDVPPGKSLKDVKLPGTLVATPTQTTQTSPTPQPQQQPAPGSPGAGGGSPQDQTNSGQRVNRERDKARKLTAGDKPKAKHEPSKKGGDQNSKAQLRKADGTPTPQNPGFVDALPGPSRATGVPNFIIRKFRVPPFLLSIYQAAGIQYGVRWEVLAAINEIETDYGRNLNVSTAGAVGWMQFMPSTWRRYGTDANQDRRKDPYNPVDAIFAAARYLKAAGYQNDVRRSIFAYNHADWYVDSVLLRARLIAGVPADLIGSLTGLTEGRFPVYAHARYADDLAEAKLLKQAKPGQNAANLVQTADQRRSIDIYSRTGAPVIAVNDGEIQKVGNNDRLGHYVVLQDVYGNRYTYAHLGEVSKYYPVPKQDATDLRRAARALKANAAKHDPKPTTPASAGRQPAHSKPARPADQAAAAPQDTSSASVPIKQRLFAHPDMEGARQAGGLEQLLDSKASKDSRFETYKNYFSRPFGLDASKVTLRRLRKGARVIGGTIIGRIGQSEQGKAPHLEFSIRPAGKGAPRIDPKPILDGWKLLEATAVYRSSGRNVLHGGDSGGMSIGQILLLPKPQLEKRVLADERIDIYSCGRDDIRSGQIDRRVLATLAYLAESGLRPTVTSLKCGHGFYTSSGHVSEHSSGNAVDISKVNGIPIVGHQEPGGITEQTVRSLMQLQGTMAPHQIISLLDLGGATLAMADHADHIHVGFQPMFGANRKLGRQALAVLKPGQWSDLLARLAKIDNPVVPTKPSKYALPVKPASSAHSGE